jgi:hypothetical protein
MSNKAIKNGAILVNVKELVKILKYKEDKPIE